MSEKNWKRMRRLEKELGKMDCERESLERAYKSVYADWIHERTQRQQLAYDAKKTAKSESAWRCIAFAAILFIVLVALVALVSDADAAEEPATEETVYVDTIPAVNIPEIPDSCPEANENELIEAALLERAHKIDDVKVTHYCCEKYPHICGTGDGITYSGREATPGVSIAVDPELIPLGSTVMVDYGDGELVYYRADDIGGAVKGKHIDVCMATHQEALNAGVQTVTLYWAEEG